MKPLPANNGSALPKPNGESDLEAIIERIAPERRVDFLRWRERVKRHGDNDELLAVVGYLDTSVVLWIFCPERHSLRRSNERWPQLKRRLKTKRRLPLESRASRWFSTRRR